MVHAVKTTPRSFDDAVNGTKPFEIRKNGRNYRLYDYIVLVESDAGKDTPARERFSKGRSALFRISYIHDDPEHYKDGYVAMGLVPCEVRTEAGLVQAG